MEIEEYRRMAEVEATHWWYKATNAHLKQLLDPYLPSDGSLIDVGCGTGAVGMFLANYGHLVGADFSELALKLYREQHPAIDLTAADVNQLPFATDSFDVTLCVTVLCHQSIPEPSDAVAELARITKPGGIVCLWEPGVERLRRAHDRVTHSARRFSVKSLARLLSENDLEVLRSTGAHSYLVAPAAVKSVFEHGESASDLDKHQRGLGGTLGRLADLERRWLKRHSLPAGLSVTAIGRK